MFDLDIVYSIIVEYVVLYSIWCSGAKNVPNKMIEKFDEYLPDDLINIGYGAQAFDIEGLKLWLDSFCN